MKALILLEGNNDGIFLKEIIQNTAFPNIRPNYYKNQGTKPQKKVEETKLLRGFCRKDCEYNLLIKEEGGKGFVLSLFHNVIVNFLIANKNIHLTVIFDHDGNDPTKEIEKINKNLQDKTFGRIELKPAVPKKQIIPGLYSREFFLTINQGKYNRNLTSFSFISFDKSLECEVAKLCHKSENEIDENDIKFFASKIKFNDLIPNSP